MLADDGADRRDVGCDDVGGIQSPAQADFQDREIYVLHAKPGERHCGADLKRGGVATRCGAGSLDRAASSGHQASERRRVNWLAVDLKAFAKGMEVRLGVEAGAQASGLGGRGNQRAHAALALAAGHVNDWQVVVRVAKIGQQP